MFEPPANREAAFPFPGVIIYLTKASQSLGGCRGRAALTPQITHEALMAFQEMFRQWAWEPQNVEALIEGSLGDTSALAARCLTWAQVYGCVRSENDPQ